MSPYIKQNNREVYDSLVLELAKRVIDTSEQNASNWKGDVNYICFKLLRSMEQYLGSEYKFKFGYQDHSDAVAALRDCADEYVRRVLAPYEDIKIQENGDVI